MTTTRDDLSLSNPQAIVDAAEEIYNRKYRADLEQSCLGEFVAINVLTEEAFTAKLPEEALEKARRASPGGLFHLMKIGASGAFRVSYSSSRGDGWGLRSAR